eukprot:12398891-Karenia_brevis.AAC.1
MAQEMPSALPTSIPVAISGSDMLLSCSQRPCEHGTDGGSGVLSLSVTGRGDGAEHCHDLCA